MNLTEFILKNSYSDEEIKNILDNISGDIEEISYGDMLGRYARNSVCLSGLHRYSSCDESEEDVKQLYEEAQEIETQRDYLLDRIEKIETVQDSLTDTIVLLCSLLEENKSKMDKILEIVNG